MRRVGTLLALIAATAGIAAVPASGAATRAEFIAEADPICAEANEVAKKRLKGFPADVRAERWGNAIRDFQVTLKAFNREIELLSRIDPPVADAALIEEWIDGLRAQSPLARGVIRALRKKSLPLVARSTRRLADKSLKTQDLVAGFGFRDCDDA